MKREVEEKPRFEEAGRAEVILMFTANSSLHPHKKGFLFGSREINRGEEGSRSLVGRN